VSRKNAGVLWIHNDSGDGPRLFAVDRSGMLLGTYTLQGASADDERHNAEALFVDPASGDLFIVTKSGERSHLFRKRGPWFQ